MTGEQYAKCKCVYQICMMMNMRVRCGRRTLVVTTRTTAVSWDRTGNRPSVP